MLTAASLKGWAFWHGITVAEALVTSPPLQFLIILGELALALWLLSGWRTQPAMTVAFVVFVSFASASLWLALQGRASCGCFGTLSVNPWLMFAVDLAAVGFLLAAIRFGAREGSPASPSPLTGEGAPASPSPLRVEGWGGGNLGHILLRPALFALLLLAVGYFGLYAAGRDPQQLLARWRGDLIVVQPAELDFGTGQAGELVRVPVRLVNVTDRPIRIVGGSSDCSCIVTQDLPLLLPAGEAKAIEISVRRTGSPGIQRRKYLLYTDHPRQPRVFAGLVGRVVE